MKAPLQSLFDNDYAVAIAGLGIPAGAFLHGNKVFVVPEDKDTGRTIQGWYAMPLNEVRAVANG